MKKPLTYLESTEAYRKEEKKGKIGKQSIEAIEHEVKVYQRSHPVSRWIMDVVYQTHQKAKWLNYQKNKEFFETSVKEEPTEEKPQPFPQKEKEESNPMIESYLFPVSTTNDNSTNKVSSVVSQSAPDKVIQENILQEFKNSSLKLFHQSVFASFQFQCNRVPQH